MCCNFDRMAVVAIVIFKILTKRETFLEMIVYDIMEHDSN